MVRDLHLSKWVPVDRQLIGDSACALEKAGVRYDIGDDGGAERGEYGEFPLWTGRAEYQSDEMISVPGYSQRQLAYRMKLSGAHAGPPIEIFMTNPRDEPDEEGGRDFVWDALLWVADCSKFDIDWLLDTYTDPLRNELRDIARNWTS